MEENNNIDTPYLTFLKQLKTINVNNDEPNDKLNNDLKFEIKLNEELDKLIKKNSNNIKDFENNIKTKIEKEKTNNEQIETLKNNKTKFENKKKEIKNKKQISLQNITINNTSGEKNESINIDEKENLIKTVRLMEKAKLKITKLKKNYNELFENKKYKNIVNITDLLETIDDIIDELSFKNILSKEIDKIDKNKNLDQQMKKQEKEAALINLKNYQTDLINIRKQINELINYNLYIKNNKNTNTKNRNTNDINKKINEIKKYTKDIDFYDKKIKELDKKLFNCDKKIKNLEKKNKKIKKDVIKQYDDIYNKGRIILDLIHYFKTDVSYDNDNKFRQGVIKLLIEKLEPIIKQLKGKSKAIVLKSKLLAIQQWQINANPPSNISYNLNENKDYTINNDISTRPDVINCLNSTKHKKLSNILEECIEVIGDNEKYENIKQYINDGKNNNQKEKSNNEIYLSILKKFIEYLTTCDTNINIDTTNNNSLRIFFQNFLTLINIENELDKNDKNNLNIIHDYIKQIFCIFHLRNINIDNIILDKYIEFVKIYQPIIGNKYTPKENSFIEPIKINKKTSNISYSYSKQIVDDLNKYIQTNINNINSNNSNTKSNNFIKKAFDKEAIDSSSKKNNLTELNIKNEKVNIIKNKKNQQNIINFLEYSEYTQPVLQQQSSNKGSKQGLCIVLDKDKNNDKPEYSFYITDNDKIQPLKSESEQESESGPQKPKTINKKIQIKKKDKGEGEGGGEGEKRKNTTIQILENKEIQTKEEIGKAKITLSIADTIPPIQITNAQLTAKKDEEKGTEIGTNSAIRLLSLHTITEQVSIEPNDQSIAKPQTGLNTGIQIKTDPILASSNQTTDSFSLTDQLTKGETGIKLVNKEIQTNAEIGTQTSQTELTNLVDTKTQSLRLNIEEISIKPTNQPLAQPEPEQKTGSKLQISGITPILNRYPALEISSTQTTERRTGAEKEEDQNNKKNTYIGAILKIEGETVTERIGTEGEGEGEGGGEGEEKKEKLGEKEEEEEEEGEGDDNNSLNLHDYIVNLYILIANLPNENPENLFKGALILAGKNKLEGILVSQNKFVSQILNGLPSTNFEHFFGQAFTKAKNMGIPTRELTALEIFLRRTITMGNENRIEDLKQLLKKYIELRGNSNDIDTKNNTIIRKQLFGLLTQVLMKEAEKLVGDSFKAKYYENIEKIERYVTKSVELENDILKNKIKIGPIPGYEEFLNSEKNIPIDKQILIKYENTELNRINLLKEKEIENGKIDFTEEIQKIRYIETADEPFNIKHTCNSHAENVREYLWTSGVWDGNNYENVSNGRTRDNTVTNDYQDFIDHYYNNLKFSSYKEEIREDGSRVLEYCINPDFTGTFRITLPEHIAKNFDHLDFDNYVGKSTGFITGFFDYIDKNYTKEELDSVNFLNCFEFYDKQSNEIQENEKKYEFLKTYLCTQKPDRTPTGNIPPYGQRLINKYLNFGQIIEKKNLEDASNELNNEKNQDISILVLN